MQNEDVTAAITSTKAKTEKVIKWMRGSGAYPINIFYT